MMTDIQGPTLAAYVGELVIRPIVKKKLFGGYEVPLGPLLTTAGTWLFQWGAILGRARGDRLELLAKVVAEEGAATVRRASPEIQAAVDSGQRGDDHWTYEYLLKLAKDAVAFYGREPDSFLDFYATALIPPDCDFRDMHKVQQLLKQKIRLGEALARADQWLLAGISFGATYPELTERLWKRAYETPEGAESQEIRALGRQAGLDVPEEQELRPLNEMEVTVLIELTNYLKHCFPELIEPLMVGDRRVYELRRAVCPHCAGRRETLGWVFGLPVSTSEYVFSFVCEDHKGAGQALDKRLHEKRGLDYEGDPDKIGEPVEVKCALCLTSKGTTHADPNKGSWWFLCNDCEPRARELIETGAAADLPL